MKDRFAIKPNRKNQCTRVEELNEMDADLIISAYPGNSPYELRMRQMFELFLRSLRGAPGHKNNTRAVTIYLKGEALHSLFEGRNYFIDTRALKAEDGVARLIRLLIEDHARLVKLWKSGEVVFKSKVRGDVSYFIAPNVSIPKTATEASQDSSSSSGFSGSSSSTPGS